MKGLTTVKQGKATTVQDRSGKCLTVERELLNLWTEYCTKPMEIHHYWTFFLDTEDYHPIIRKEVDAAIQLLNEGK